MSRRPSRPAPSPLTETDGGAKTMTLNVLVEADAIQAEGFENAAAAWAAFTK